MKILRQFGVVLLLVIGVFVALVYMSVSETRAQFKTCEIHDRGMLDFEDFRTFDSVLVSANTLYEASMLKTVVQGEQYREAWNMPVRVPIVFLDTLMGGMKIIEEGGGKQTHSLELEDPKGIRFTLRSVTKNPKPLIPKVAEALGLANIVIDGVSAQHPYAALVVSRLASAADILHTHPKLVFIPKQARLGDYNDKYGNRLYLLEYESEGEVNWTGMPGVKELVDTEDLLELKLEMGNSLNIDRKRLIRARLFDLIIGDWDRHAKQWGWALREAENSLTAIPVPADRDNAFFNPEGILPSLIANNLTLPEVQPFEEEIEYLPGLVSQFDSYFLRGAAKDEFIKEARQLQFLLSNEQVDNAFQSWPLQIYELDGPEIAASIKSRRDDIVEYASQFKDLLDSRLREPIQLNGAEELTLPSHMKSCFDCLDQPGNSG